MKARIVCIGAACCFCFAFIRPAAAQSDAERLRSLEQAMRQLQERNAQLESKVKTLEAKSDRFAPMFPQPEKKAAAAGSDNKAVFAEPSPPPVDVHPGGFELKLTLGGYFQANFETGDVSAFEGRFGATALKDRFRLRRTRINLIGDFAEQFDFKIEGDFEQSDGLSPSTRTGFSGTDIFVNWHRIPELNVKVGQWKAPFGLEQLTPDPTLLTIERSLPTGALTPERQIGVMVWGKPLSTVMADQKDLVTYYVGAFNGNGRNFNNNDNNEFMYVGRLELQPFKGKFMGQDASLKIAGDYLFSRDDAGTTISPALNLRVGPDGSLSAYTLTSADERHAWSVDGWLKVGPFDLIAEYLNENVDGRTVAGVAPTFADFNPHGWYVLGGYYIIPKKLQAVVKWEELSPDQRPDDGIHSITGGLNYYIHGDGIKVMGNYVHTWSDFRKANPGLGDDQFDELILRLQVMF
jgi:phosphate-selective porin